MFEPPEFYLDASPLGKSVLIVVLVAGVIQLVVAAVLPFVIWLRRRRRHARGDLSKCERVEAMARAEDEAAKLERRRNEAAPVRALRRLLAHLTPRGLWQATRCPSSVGLAVDGLAFVGFVAVLVVALQRVDHWSEPVPVTRQSIEQHEAIEFREPANRPVFFAQQFFEVTDLDGECCKPDTMAQLPSSALDGGYKLVVLGKQQMWPDPARGHANGRLQCDAAWRQAGWDNLAIARMMATVEHLKAPFGVDVWYVNTTRPIRPGDRYLAPPFQRACTQPGGCFSRYLLAGKPTLGLQDRLVREGRLSGADHRSADEFMRIVNGGRPQNGNGAYILDEQGRVRAHVEQTGDTSTLDIISAVFAIARADGHELPQELLTHFRAGDAGRYEAEATPYFEQRVEHDAGIDRRPTYDRWLDRLNTRGVSRLIPGTGTLGEWARLGPPSAVRYGLDRMPDLGTSSDANQSEEDGNDV